MDLNLPQLLKTQCAKGASDLHISVGSPPKLRINGELYPIKAPPLRPSETAALCLSALSDEQKRYFEEKMEIDFSFGVKGLARFRGNIFRQKGHVGGVFRMIPQTVKSMDELNLPPVVRNLCSRRNGLVLVTGTTGSGKSTTLASMVDHINSSRSEHIVTIEDPIEFVHQHKNCVVNQREIGTDSNSFAAALKSALRQDPDVVLIGELRDLETISAALTIAETGHLVFATLHTNTAVSTISRIIDVFPAHQQGQVRNQLAQSLQGVICQMLLPGVKGGRVLSMEIMIPTPGIRAQIREDKLHMIQQSIQVGAEKTGAQTRNQNLLALTTRGAISPQTALAAAHDIDELRIMLSRGKAG